MRSGIMDDINFILASLEGRFHYDSGPFHYNNTGSQSQGSPVSTIPPR